MICFKPLTVDEQTRNKEEYFPNIKRRLTVKVNRFLLFFCRSDIKRTSKKACRKAQTLQTSHFLDEIIISWRTEERDVQP